MYCSNSNENIQGVTPSYIDVSVHIVLKYMEMRWVGNERWPLVALYSSRDAITPITPYEQLKQLCNAVIQMKISRV